LLCHLKAGEQLTERIGGQLVFLHFAISLNL
jgi:hypothetical protein